MELTSSRRLQSDLLHRIAPLKLPSFCHIQHVIEWFVRMRGRAYKAILIIAFAHYDFVDNFLNPLTTRTNDSHE